MAMNPRGGYSGYRYGGYNFNRRKQPVRHENFEPISEQREEDGALIILVHLPGTLEISCYFSFRHVILSKFISSIYMFLRLAQD